MGATPQINNSENSVLPGFVAKTSPIDSTELKKLYQSSMAA